MINYNFAIPVAENIPFDTFLKYIGLREHRKTGAISAICNAIRDLPQRKRPDMRIVVLETSLFSRARADQDILDVEAARSSFKQNVRARLVFETLILDMVSSIPSQNSCSNNITRPQ